MDELKKYLPAAMIIAAIFIQYNLFATPKDLAELHKGIMQEIDNRYATKSDTSFLREQVNDMKNKIDKIYDKVIGGR